MLEGSTPSHFGVEEDAKDKVFTFVAEVFTFSIPELTAVQGVNGPL